VAWVVLYITINLVVLNISNAMRFRLPIDPLQSEAANDLLDKGH